MQYSRMRQEFETGPAIIRLDFLAVIAVAAVIASPRLAICLAVAVTLHELGHAAAARWVAGEPLRVLIQLSGGRAYVRNVESKAKRALVLAAGLLASGALIAIGGQLTRVDFQWG